MPRSMMAVRLTGEAAGAVFQICGRVHQKFSRTLTAPAGTDDSAVRFMNSELPPAAEQALERLSREAPPELAVEHLRRKCFRLPAQFLLPGRARRAQTSDFESGLVCHKRHQSLDCMEYSAVIRNRLRWVIIPIETQVA